MKILRVIAFLIGLILFSCSPSSIVRTEVLKCDVPTLPEVPKYLPVTFKLVGDKYTLDSDNAKALYLNIRMIQTRDIELTTILENLKGK